MDSNQLQGKKVLLFGLGLHGGGLATAKYLLRSGVELRITDRKTRSQLRDVLKKLPHVKGTFGKEKKQDVEWCDIVVKNPSIPNDAPLLQYARKKRKVITSDIQIFYRAIDKIPEIAVTGSRGKSTTTALIGSILSQSSKPFVGGNIRIPVLSRVQFAKSHPVVLELSSWQIEDAFASSISPHIAVLTCLFPEHLNRYSTYAAYKTAKYKLFSFQEKNDYAVLNFDQPDVRKIAKKLKAKVIYFSKKKLPKNIPGAFYDNNWLWVQRLAKKEKICKADNIPLPGEHNIMNVLAAISTAAVYGIPKKEIQKGIITFRQLPGRLETVRKIKSVTFINDTTSTSPDALVAALRFTREKFMDEQKHIIVGGSDKRLSYSILNRVTLDSTFYFYVLPGAASKKIVKNLQVQKENIVFCSTMKKAITLSYRKAKGSKAVILLSPGAASFGLFKHEFDRGDAFNRGVESL